MASYNMPAAVPRPAVYGSPVPIADPNAPPGTFAPGTKIQVGSHKVVIQKYFSEGGFAHVYLVKMQKPIDGTDIAILKRVAVPDKEHLANMRTEVETMKKLKGHRPIVTYYDSHASQLKGGGYEVFLLMEFCNGGGLIDFMNTRLQNRLTEPEILKIFSDVAEGVACMHYLKPPLLHRDLKVENVLITSTTASRRFKLCDFGSTAPPRPAATTAAECRLIEDDVQKHTTLQYRSPEMIDVYRKQPIDEKSDIWALASMLKEKPTSRPNIYQVLREACLMQGIEVPIKDPAKPNPSPMRGTISDPFAALDSKSPVPVVDEISNRFPSLDQFSLLHDGGKFDFGSSSPPKTTAPISQRVTERLADDAFALPSRPGTATKSSAPMSRAQQILASNPLELQTSDVPASIVYQPTPTHPTANASSQYLESNMDFLREKEGRPSLDQRNPSYSKETAVADTSSDDDNNIQSNVDFLKSMEETDNTKKDRRRSSASKQSKRSSMPTMSLSGTKNLLAGKFGDAFKRFEHNASAPPGPRTPSPLQDLERRDLTPIAGSEATDGRSDDGNVPDDNNLTPEQRREQERRRLSLEEKRVADAAAEYRKRIADRAPRSIGGVTRAASIQHKVKSLLDENRDQQGLKKTAEGYGRYTDAAPVTQSQGVPGNPYTLRKAPVVGNNDLAYAKPRMQQVTPSLPATKTGPRPSAPPKPTHLNSSNTGAGAGFAYSPPKGGFLAGRQGQGLGLRQDMTQQEKEEYLEDFSRRFPSLSSIEMVEREIGGGEGESGIGGGGGRDAGGRVVKEL
ncbi:Serine threonine- kinase ppk30 protein [Rutstroemia sp. NJR-2017a BBW]|nr:Serine threonine- kinase ppk30 protein [Rutstroemia sp. NJR-2017a BBW]